MYNIAILVPVCSRNQTYDSLGDTPLFKILYRSFLKTKEENYNYTFFIGFDDDDEFYKKFEPALMDDFKTFQLTDCQHAPASAWNKLARIAYYDAEINYDYFFQIGDDVELLTSGWTTQFITKLKEHNNIGVVGPCYKENYDGRIRDGNPPVIENAFVHRKHLDIFGYFFHPSIKNWFCDDWINRIYDGIFSEIQVDIECINTVLGNRYNVENIYYTYKEIIEKSKQSLIPKKVFSYCVFGTNPKYCKGMIRNLEQISELFPEYETWIYLGNDVPQEYIDQYKTFNNVKLIPTLNNTLRMMIFRWFPLDNPFVEVLFLRDADSRFGKRDIWCIEQFLKSEYLGFTIRDHPWHAEPLMGGLSGFKQLPNTNIQQCYKDFVKSKNMTIDYYQTDQHFAKEYIYTKYFNNIIAYTDFTIIPDEHYSRIECTRECDTDFCGNVYYFDKNGNELVEFNMNGKI